MKPAPVKPKRPQNPEILAMARIARILDELEPKQCLPRVIDWLKSKYGGPTAGFLPLGDGDAKLDSAR